MTTALAAEPGTETGISPTDAEWELIDAIRMAKSPDNMLTANEARIRLAIARLRDGQYRSRLRDAFLRKHVVPEIETLENAVFPPFLEQASIASDRIHEDKAEPYLFDFSARRRRVAGDAAAALRILLGDLLPAEA
jgi:hypothetical protein